jgi:hypothetical protein
VPAGLGVGLPLLLGLVHVALVAPHYFVGSFDDDASYVLTAKALVSGTGLTGSLRSGEVMVGLYPPGYGALLAPLAWLWPHTFTPMRLLSTICFAAVFPLMWVYLGRHGMSTRLRTAALVLLALGPPFATYGTMIMAEAPFLVVLLLLLLAVDRWQESGGVWTRSGLATLVLAATLVWFKQAAVGLVLGLIMWFLLRRLPGSRKRGAALAAFMVAALIPVVVARWVAGIPLGGARYSQELGGFYQGGLFHRLLHVLPSSGWHLLSSAIPATVVPYLQPLPIQGHWPDLWKALSLVVAGVIVIGAVQWARQYRDAAVPMAVVYLMESILWPFVNERRAILILPLLVAWLVTGGAWLWGLVRPASTRRITVNVVRYGAMVVAAAVVVFPLLVQMPRDYLYGWNQNGSHFAGSRYASVLSKLGRPEDVVETDYRSSTALFTGHTTNWNAFVDDQPPVCYGPHAVSELERDRADFLLLGAVNKPGVMDNSCLSSLTANASWAVEILHTERDNASVYELIGPGTAQPALADALAGLRPVASVTSRSTELTWVFPSARPIAQLSLGQAAATAGATTGVELQVEQPDGRWIVEARAPSAVGDGSGRAPYLLAVPPTPVPVMALRVVVEGPSAGAGTQVTDVVALGPAPSGA